ncbi:DUF1643 domain-containing protein [Bacillus cereus group sp. BfR-BA-01380]|uniref:DUF1643 domain-containing protein n=1 Tax=Bacillus cereus group sp. BfR-BA-01380 TaxID=2920324 RepID=UPI001F577221|nr:DUF1643 domain-containing protein [Bacillus cereus group sp. BfR-BA-01380]
MNFEKRERLTITLNNKAEDADKVVSIIMMNPSIADEHKSDTTVNKVISFFADDYIEVVKGAEINTENIKTLNILNLFSLYNSNSENLNADFKNLRSLLPKQKFNAIFDKNLAVIKQTLKESDYIILAWGMPEDFHLTLYFSMINHILSYLFTLDKLVYVFQASPYRVEEKKIHSRELNPYHPIAVKLKALSQVGIKTGPLESYMIVY